MESGLVERLRSQIQDERYNTPAFTLSITDTGVTTATLEIKPGSFTIDTVGGSVPPIFCDLNSDRYNTVSKLANQLNAIPGISATLDGEVNSRHPSIDIELYLPTDISGNVSIPIRTHRFSDQEMRSIIRTAIRRHNLAYTPDTLPPDEADLVMLLAQSGAMSVLANDSSKRKGMDETVDTLLSLSKHWEELYTNTYERNKRVIPSPQKTPKQQALNNSGDITVATLYRRSPRNGFMTPMASVGAPLVAILQDPQPGDIQDVLATVRWDRDLSDSLLAYELWRDTQEDVIRNPSGGFNNIPQGWTMAKGGPYQQPSSAKLVYSMNGPNSTWGQFTTRYGQLTNQVVDMNVQNGQQYGLEPDTDYFYRLYVISVNRDVTSSDVLRVHTLPRRALFVPSSPLSPVAGPVGSAAQVQVLNADSNTVLLIDGKPLVDLNVTTVSGVTTFAGNIPAFYSMGPKDLVLRSGSGLTDLLVGGFTVTSS